LAEEQATHLRKAMEQRYGQDGHGSQ